MNSILKLVKQGEYKIIVKETWLEIHDENDNQIYGEDPRCHWWLKEFDEKGNRTYSEDSFGYIVDNRPAKEYTISQLEKLLNEKIKIVK